jgi:hypothetical protein
VSVISRESGRTLARITRSHVGAGDTIEHGRANLAAALYKAHHGHLVTDAPALGKALPISDKCFVCLYRLHVAAHRREFAITHRFTKPMRHEPASLDGHAKRAGKLVAADTLLGTAKQVGRLEPLMQLQVAGLEHGPFADRELAPAVVAFPEAMPNDAFRVCLARLGTLIGKPVETVNRATVRAGRAVGPNDSLQGLKGCLFIVEIGFV